MANKRVKYPLPKRQTALLAPFSAKVLSLVAEFGGFHNAHAHLCRASTIGKGYLEHIGTTPIEASDFPLPVKQNMVGNLHDGLAYTYENLLERMRYQIERQIALGVTRLDTNIDATPDLPEDGLMAINIALRLKEEYKDRIDLRIAPTPIFGFNESRGESPTRWEVFKAAAQICDYLSLLPEKDDPRGDRGKIGFKPHCHRGLQLALELGKEIQFHTDQANDPNECGTEWLLDVLEGFEQPQMPGDEPWVWVIHMISPSAYGEKRFYRLVKRLLDQNVGVIVCPSAAASMRQLRSLDAPTHNSIARVAELSEAGVRLRLGSDNIGDVFVPQATGDMHDEIIIGVNNTRLQKPAVWAKIGAGKPLNKVDMNNIDRVLGENEKAYRATNPEWVTHL